MNIKEHLTGGVMPREDFVYVEVDGVRATLAYWAKHYGIPYSVFKTRYGRYGWDIEKLCAPIRAYRR
jgi:hypothetical protein